jgi:hypothetical protein
MYSCLIYFALTFVIPLRLTYIALKSKSDLTAAQLWSSYWALYSSLLLLKSMLTFLT